MVNKIAKNRNTVLALLIVSILMTITMSLIGFAMNSGFGNNSSLIIWDNEDAIGGDQELWSYDTAYSSGYTGCDQKSSNQYSIYFYANYSNSTEIDDVSGSCEIRFDENNTGSYSSWDGMIFNSTSDLWEYDRYFTADGNLSWQVNCTSSTYSDIFISDKVYVSNTETCINNTDPGGNLPDLILDEDNITYYYFNETCTDDDLNDLDNLRYGYISENTSLTNFTFDTNIGLLTINVTHDDDTGNKQIELTVKDDGPTQSAILPVTINAVNDPPQFSNLDSIISADEDDRKTQNITATDEEDNTPFTFNITFMNCTRTNPSPGNPAEALGEACAFGTWNWTSGNTWLFYNFTPENNETGNYTVKFYVEDNGTTNNPHYANTSVMVTILVRGANDRPNLTYVCDNELNATEDIAFSSTVNATDEDEAYNLTFNSNYSWFLSTTVVDYNVSLDNQANTTISFTPTDSMVGNWSINVTVTDTGNITHQNVKTAYRVINFMVYNVNDTAKLNNITNQTAYINTPFTLTITAEDDDLRVPDKSVYDESITFDYTNVSGGLPLTITKLTVSGNTSPANITFTPDTADVGNHTINISITDISGNTDYDLFKIEVKNNTPAQWNTSLISNTYNLTEDINFYLNLSELAYDSDGDDIDFTSNATGVSFPSFTLDGETGIINFTPVDSDSGIHNVNMGVTDDKGLTTYHVFTFNVSYTLEAPSLDSVTDQNATEDVLFTLYINATDGDLLIPNNVYEENLTFTDNTSIFNITKYIVIGNITRGLINFTPDTDDIGDYSINISVIDKSNNVSTIFFNLTILGVNDAPYFTHNITNQTAYENQTFYYDFNATDEEYGDESSGNITFKCNVSWINDSLNHTTGVINVTPDNSEVGTYSVNLSISDPGGASNYTIFILKVYEINNAPEIIDQYPASNPITMNENSSLNFGALANDSNFGSPNNDSLTCTWTLNGQILNVTQGYTGGSYVTTTYLTGFTGETTGGSLHNFTVRFNDSAGLQDNYTWRINVTHVNAPPNFTNTILNQSGSSGLQIDLDDYFEDVDHDDTRYNQSINFTWVQYTYEDNWSSLGEDNLTVSYEMGTSLDDDTYSFTFTAGSDLTKIFKITAIDSDDSSMNVSSNLFQVHIVPSGDGSQTRGSTGGGSSTVTKIISLDIVTPGNLNIYTNDTLISWISVENNGKEKLNDINLNLTHTEGIEAELNETHLDSLSEGERKNLTLTISSFKKSGDEEVIIEGKVGRPVVSDKAKIHITILEEIVEIVEEKIAFTEELITENPACLDLIESVEEAKRLYAEGLYERAIEVSDEAVRKCKAEVSQTVVQDRREIPLLRPYISQEFSIFLVLFIVLIVVSYYTKRFLLGRKGKGKFKSKEEIKIKVE